MADIIAATIMAIFSLFFVVAGLSERLAELRSIRREREENS